MARYLIVYAGRTGTASGCAQQLRKKLISADAVNAARRRELKKLRLGDYQAVVLGCSVHMDRLHPAFRRFLRRHCGELSGKKLGFFLCCAFPERARQLLEEQLERTPAPKPVAVEWLGGDISPKRLSPLGRLLAAMVRRGGEVDELAVDQRAVARLADAMLKSLW